MVSIFRNATYFLEGDGPLIFVAYDKIMLLFHFIQNPQWPNVDSVIDSILANHEAQDINQRQITFKNHALGVVRPGFEYFKSKFDPEAGELAPQMQLLKLARLCHPIRLRELRPPAEQLDELFQFKVIHSEDAPVSMQGLRNEYAMYLALAADINGEEFTMDNILLFLQNHCKELPTWAKLATLLATQQISSSAVKRVFSFLKTAFKQTQEKALSRESY